MNWLPTSSRTSATCALVAALLACTDEVSVANDGESRGQVLARYNLDGTDAQPLHFTTDSRGAVLLAAIELGAGDYGAGAVADPSSAGPTLVLARYNHRLEHVWSTTAPGAGITSVRVRAAPDGDSVVLVDGAATLELAGSSHPLPLVARLSGADGSVMWTRSFADRSLADLDLAPDGRACVVGSSAAGAYVAQLGADAGELTWELSIETTDGGASAARVASDVDASCFVTGPFSGTLPTLDDLTAQTDASWFVAKISGDAGAPAWATELANDAPSEPLVLATASDGDVFVAGALRSPSEAPMTQLTARLARLSGANGGGVWATQLAAGSLEALRVAGVCAHPGAVSLAGSFRGVATLGSTTLSSTTVESLLVLHVADASGVPNWIRQSASAGDVAAAPPSCLGDETLVGGTFVVGSASTTRHEVFFVRLGR